LIELIIVIVIAGILAAVMIPRLERDNLREATNQVVRHIQYTQHLAMVDDVYDASNTNWRQNRWSIDLCTTDYSIARSDNSTVALDVMTQRDINGTDNDLSNHGVTAITPSVANKCKLVFDNLGRPYVIATGATTTTASDLAPTTTFTLTASGRTSVITIVKETGYTSAVVN